MLQICEPRAARANSVGAGDDLSSQRAHAEAVLKSLIEAKEACEQQAAANHRSDLFKAVTGRSALDAAIVSTKRIIDQIDRQLGESASGAMTLGTRLVRL